MLLKPFVHKILELWPWNPDPSKLINVEYQNHFEPNYEQSHDKSQRNNYW